MPEVVVAHSTVPLSKFGATARRDAWWLENLPVIALMGGFTVYATWRAFEGAHYQWGPYLSPFYSPLIDPEHHWWRFSPALLILVFPLGFRGTCYYYRKALYRAFLGDPPACAVGEFWGHGYRGEAKLPLILMNLHRYFLYAALIFLIFLWHDVIKAMNFNGSFGIGVGTVVLFANTSLLTLYTLSCHSLRHIVGGRLDCFSCSSANKTQHSAWKLSSILNERHMLFAWCSLLSVGFADFYVRLVATGAIKDIRLL
jgi:hypothetical protein